MVPTFTLNDVSPEIFPIIASHLPLYATPSTLRSLALVNQHIAEIVLPLVYSRVLLRNEQDAMKIIHRLLDEPQLGLAVRELHIMCDLSIETRNGQNPFDVVTGLKMVIKAGLLPYIHTLGLQLLSGWRYDENFESLDGYGQLRSEFWTSLRDKCPRLKALILQNVGDVPEDRWLEDSGLYEIKGISSLTVALPRLSLPETTDRLYSTLDRLSSSLHTLSLHQSLDWYFASPLLSLHFPCLVSLTLTSCEIADASEAVEFWRRHPNIEYLDLTDSYKNNHWFTENISPDFFPNLRYLKADYHEVRILAPVLHRLVGLGIYRSVNTQIPYLLRFVLPGGLPNLKTLFIGQMPSAPASTSGGDDKIDGELWYEMEDLNFKGNDMQSAKLDIFDNYMHSIAKGAPNLEELGVDAQVWEFDGVGLKLALFSHLERLYCNMFTNEFEMAVPMERKIFHGVCCGLAKACKSLQLVTNTESHNLPYMNARIRRNDAGEVRDVTIGEGVGMQIGNEDAAFPAIRAWAEFAWMTTA